MNHIDNVMTNDDSVAATIRSYLNNNFTTPNKSACNLQLQPQDIALNSRFHISAYFMYIIIFVVALAGNGMVCLVRSSPRMNTVTHYFISHLAISDLVITIFSIPFAFLPIFYFSGFYNFWPFGDFMCRFVHYAQMVSLTTSVCILLIISFDRYVVITQPSRPSIRKSFAKMVMSAVWLGGLVVSIPVFIVSQLDQPTTYHRACGVFVCIEKWPNKRYREIYGYLLLLIQFAMPLIILSVVYGRIAFFVMQLRPPGEIQTIQNVRRREKKLKVIKMMFIVVVVFAVCWAPLQVVIVIWTRYKGEEEWGRWPDMPYVWFFTHSLAMSHSCWNPIIYSLMNANYRNEFLKLLKPLLPMDFINEVRRRRRPQENVGGEIPLEDFRNAEDLHHIEVN